MHRSQLRLEAKTVRTTQTLTPPLSAGFAHLGTMVKNMFENIDERTLRKLLTMGAHIVKPVCTFPEALVIEVPEYCGPAFYSVEPKWVPLLPLTAVKDGTRMTRTQFPVVAGFALTVNKAQGLTVKEGVVIHLVGGRRFRPASKHGLPFVAFTRSESFAMTAFKNIPPWQDFVRGRDSDMLRMRLAFTAKLEQMHVQTLARHLAIKTPEQEQEAHEAWLAAHAGDAKRPRKDGPLLCCPACAQ